MKTIFFVSFLLFLTSCKSKGQENHRKDAANLVNTIDSLTDSLGPAGHNLANYFKKINTPSSNNHEISQSQIDSLKMYYSSLITNYDNALNFPIQYKSFDEGDSVKNNFIVLLKIGKAPWVTLIPTYIKVYEGQESISESEKNIIDSTGIILQSAIKEGLIWAKIVGDQEDMLVEKYHLEYVDSKYK